MKTSWSILDKVCGFKMESYGYSTDDLVFQWAKESPIQVKEDLVIPRYKMEKTETDDCTKVYSTG